MTDQLTKAEAFAMLNLYLMDWFTDILDMSEASEILGFSEEMQSVTDAVVRLQLKIGSESMEAAH